MVAWSFFLISIHTNPTGSSNQANLIIFFVRKFRASLIELTSFKPKFVRTYVSHLLGTYVTILCNWLILWQNALYLYLGRSRMCLILQETVFQDQLLKTCKSVQDSSWKVLFIKALQLARQHLDRQISVELYEKQNSSSILTPICVYVFELSFLTILDI